MNLPNRITLARIATIPVFMAILLGPIHGGEYVAAAIFVLAAASDGLDGYLARKRNEVTRLGQLLDPIADKLLVTAALVSLVQLGQVPAWAAVLIVGRDLAVTGLRTIAAGEGVVIAASLLGKVKTIAQVVAIVALMVHNYPFSLIGLPVGEAALWVAVILTIISGVDYFRQALKDLQGHL